MTTRLDISLTEHTGPELEKGQEQTITPLFQSEKPKEKEVSLKEYVDVQDNKVVAFVINWIKKTFTRDLFEYLNTDFKLSIVNEIKKQKCN